jgi:hypothetical protein
MSVLIKIEEPECGWYEAGVVSCKEGILYKHPQIDDMEGWFRWFDGFNCTYAGAGDCYGRDFKRLLRRILGALLYNEVNIFLRAWRGDRL